MPISVDLGAKLEELVSELVANGRYGSKSEVLREGIRLVQERERKLAELEAKLKVGISQLDAGLGIPAEKVFSKLMRKFKVTSDEG